MFRNESLTRPKTASLIATLILAPIFYFASAHSPVMGYALAILTLIMIGAQAFFSLTVWPTLKQQENPIVFACYWGLMLGLVMPFLVERFLTEGFEGILELITSY